MPGRRHLRRPEGPPPGHKVVLIDGRECPDIHFQGSYLYLGHHVSLSGSCKRALEKLRHDLSASVAQVRGRAAGRRTQVRQANAYVLGHGLQKGIGLWLTFETADSVLGPIVRSIFTSTKGALARARAESAPAWQVHAPLRLPPTANAGNPCKPRAPSAKVTGYGLWHPFAAVGAGAHMVFWAEFSSDLPERYLPTHSAVALALYTLGCRGEDPAGFDYAHLADSLSLENPVEAALWRLCWARSGRCGSCPAAARGGAARVAGRRSGRKTG